MGKFEHHAMNGLSSERGKGGFVHAAKNWNGRLQPTGGASDETRCPEIHGQLVTGLQTTGSSCRKNRATACRTSGLL